MSTAVSLLSNRSMHDVSTMRSHGGKIIEEQSAGIYVYSKLSSEISNLYISVKFIFN